MLSWLNARKHHDPEEDAHLVRCRMGAHERSAIVAEGRDLYSSCKHCGRRLVRVGGDWRVAVASGATDPETLSRQAGRTRMA